MDTKECKLQMNELYFSKYDFIQTREDTNADYSTSFQIEYAVNRNDPAKFKITIMTSVKNETDSVHINLETVGVFSVDNNGISESLSEQLIKVNTVAIMFPFIRSQISLLTTQPGLTPVMLPPININALMGLEETE